MELADRIEQLEGPDREIDAEIAKALGYAFMWPVVWRITTPRFTKFIDEAVASVPSGYGWAVVTYSEPSGLVLANVTESFDKKPSIAHANTPAIAICAAALRAKSA